MNANDRGRAVPPGPVERIDPLCDRFEAEWLAGGWPRLEDFLPLAEEADRPTLLGELLALELEYRRRQGEQPSVEEYRLRLPEHSRLVEEAFGALRTTPPAAEASPTPDPPAGLLQHAAPDGTTVRQAGRYLLEGEIARGGMGVVLRARDPDLNRSLAIKVMREEYRGQQEPQRRFQEEAQVTGQLQHPGIPPVHEIGSFEDGRPFFAMKLIQGRTLAELLQRRSSPAEELPRFLVIFEQVCQTIAYAHSRGVIHRDLKPSNIMVGAFGEVQVMDWGLAKVLKEGPAAQRSIEQTNRIATVRTAAPELASRAGLVLGTLAYMAPEQARGEVEALDERTDVFGLGAILCEALTGGPPHQGASAWEVEARAARGDLSDALACLTACGADPELVRLVNDCLAAEQERRPRDAGVVARRMAGYLEGVQARLRRAELERVQAQVMATEERKRRRLAVALAGAAVLLLVLAGSGAVWVWQQQLRKEQQGGRAKEVLVRARVLLDEGWRTRDANMQAHDLGKLTAAKAEADRAVDIARSGSAGSDAEQETLRFQAEAEALLERARKTRRLVTALLDVSAPQETNAYTADKSGRRVALALPSADEQYVAAFRRWWNLDVDGTSESELVRRFRQIPQVAVEDLLAALDAWMLELGGPNRLGRRSERLFRLADRLDRNEESRRLRRLLVGRWRPREESVAGLVLTRLSWPALWDLGRGDWWRALRKLRSQVKPRAPVLTILLLAEASEAMGDPVGAEEVLRRALVPRPEQVVLLHALGQLLERQGRARLGEAIECYRAVRARVPRLGLAFSRALVQAGRAAEAEAVLRHFAREQPTNPEVHFQLGTCLLAQKRAGESVTAFRKAVGLEPKSAVGHNNFAVALMEQNKPIEAEKACRRAIALQPNLADPHNNLGNALAAQKKWREAEQAYHGALRVKPEYAEVYRNLGLTLREQQKPSLALAELRKAIDLRPGYADAHSSLGTLLRELGKPEEAVAACRKAIALRPNHAPAYNNLAAALWTQRRLAEAVSACQAALRLRPKYAKAYHNLGLARRDQGELVLAEAAFRASIELEGNNARAHCEFSRLLRRLKKPAEAVQAARRAVALDPGSAEAQRTLGDALLAHNERAEAARAYHQTVALCRKAVALDSKNPEAHGLLGSGLAGLGRFREAESAFRQQTRLSPQNATAYTNLGAALSQQQRWVAARAALDKALALDPNNALAYSTQGHVLSGLKTPAAAEAACRKAIALRSDLVEAHNNLGNALREQGKLKQAVAAYRRALDLRPSYAFAHNNLGVALYQLGKLDQAAASFQTAIRHDPNYTNAFINLGNMRLLQAHFKESLAAFGRAGKLLRPGTPGYKQVQSMVNLCKGFASLEARLPAMLKGTSQPVSAEEQFQFAVLCVLKKHYASAARFFRKGIAADPKRAEDVRSGIRLSAASAAALAGCGQGKDAARLTVEARAALRKEARDWLQADLTGWNKALDSDAARSKAALRQQMQRWQRDPGMGGVRDKAALAKLPEDERKKWQKLWADVAAFLERAEGK
jgi:serine/threonine-protein kinase